jgi:DNA-binding transcriptional MerR regulator
MNTYTIGEVAGMAGISVRTLHHYDAIGLLSPGRRSNSGYRLYGEADIDRLRAILTYRELGLGLEEIADAITSVDGSLATLRRARVRMAERIGRLEEIVASIDRAITAHEKGITMSADEKLSVFGDFDPAEHAAEAEERWGSSSAYRQSAQRTASYTSNDWAAIMAEADEIYARAATLSSEGAAATDPEAAELVETHRDHISNRFYDCTPAIHRGLGEMYGIDVRFAENIDKAGPGAAAFLAEAIAAYYG